MEVDWALRFLEVLSDFNIHADIAPSQQAIDMVSSIAALILLQIGSGPAHHAGHIVHLDEGWT